MKFQQAKPISMRKHPEFNEKWLQQRISADPTLLGLGDLILKDAEKVQAHAGRLDLLLTDVETLTRYEVEIQLGATDESHIIRTIEYWDIERRRYPQYDHVAVIVAEDVTSRFLNVISLFNGAIPLIAIQMRCVEVNGVVTLIATKVVDAISLATDEEDETGGAADRQYWLDKRGNAALEIIDGVMQLVTSADSELAVKYNKQYIGLARHGIADNVLVFFPRKKHILIYFRIPPDEELDARLDDSGLTALQNTKRGRRRVKITKDDLETQRELIKELVDRAVNPSE